MRLFRRTLISARIAPRITVEDALGGATEGFSSQTHVAQASISYVANTLSASGNNLNSAMYGVRQSQSIRLRLGRDVDLSVGDGVMLPGEDSVMWRCMQVDVYPYVKVARFERIAGEDE